MRPTRSPLPREKHFAALFLRPLGPFDAGRVLGAPQSAPEADERRRESRAPDTSGERAREEERTALEAALGGFDEIFRPPAKLGGCSRAALGWPTGAGARPPPPPQGRLR